MITIDLDNLTAYNGKKLIVKNGKPVNNYAVSAKQISFTELEELYAEYKRSVPNGKLYKHNYFKALNAKELNLSDMINGQNRDKAKENLEMSLLTGILNGSLIWPDKNHWFWQSEKDRDFILFRKWFEKGDIVKCSIP